MTLVRVAFVLIFVVVYLCTAEYVEKGRKTILKDNLSLNPNRCHHPLITQLTPEYRGHKDVLRPFSCLWNREQVINDQIAHQKIFQILTNDHFKAHNIIENISMSSQKINKRLVENFYLGVNCIELMINKLHGLSPSGGLVSLSGRFASLLFDQVGYFASIELCQALRRQEAIIKISVVRCHYL